MAQVNGDKRPREEQSSRAHGDQSSSARGGQSLHSQVEQSSGTSQAEAINVFTAAEIMPWKIVTH